MPYLEDNRGENERFVAANEEMRAWQENERALRQVILTLIPHFCDTSKYLSFSIIVGMQLSIIYDTIAFSTWVYANSNTGF